MTKKLWLKICSTNNLVIPSLRGNRAGVCGLLRTIAYTWAWQVLWTEFLWVLIKYMSWFRNGTSNSLSSPRLSKPTHLPPFPIHWDGIENWRHKRQRSGVQERTIYWKKKWDNKMSSNSNNTNDRGYKKSNFSHWEFSHGEKNQPNNRKHHVLSIGRNPSSLNKCPFPLPPAMTWGGSE